MSHETTTPTDAEEIREEEDHAELMRALAETDGGPQEEPEEPTP